MRHEVIVGVGRRRCWSGDQKLKVLSEAGVGGATVTEVARRHHLTRQHIYHRAAPAEGVTDEFWRNLLFAA